MYPWYSPSRCNRERPAGGQIETNETKPPEAEENQETDRRILWVGVASVVGRVDALRRLSGTSSKLALS